MAQKYSDELLGHLKNILPEADYLEIVKANKDELAKKDPDGGEEKELQKAFETAKTELKGLKKAYKMKKGELSKNPELKEIKKAYKSKKSEIKKGFGEMWAKEKGEKEPHKKEGKKVEKGLNTDLIKALTDSFSGKINTIVESNESLVKGLTSNIQALTEKNELLEKSIKTIGSQSIPFRGQTQHNFIEKSVANELDGDGKTILSVSQNKTGVIAVLEAAMEKATSDDIKKSIGNELMGYNLGGAPISESVASYLYKNHQVRLVK